MWKSAGVKCLYFIVCLLHFWFAEGRLYEPTVLTVGAIIDKDDIAQQICFRKSVQKANKLLQQHDLQQRRIQLEPIIETIDKDDSFDAAQKACSLLERQVIGIYGPTDPNAVLSVQSICNQFGIPHLQIDWGYGQVSRGFAMNVHPHYIGFGQALRAFVEHSEYWDRIGLIYQNEKDLLKYEYLLRNSNKPVLIRRWDTVNDNHKYVIKQFKMLNTYSRFIVDLPSWEIRNFLSLANSYNMTSQYYSYIFTDWDIQSLGREVFDMIEGSNVTTFSIIQSIHEESGYGIKALMEEISTTAIHDERVRRSKATQRISPTHTALLYDGVSLLAMGILSSSRTTDIQPPGNLTCFGSRSWNPGLTLLNDIKAIKPENFFGLTGTFQFDSHGWRSNVNMAIMELSRSGFQQYGYWNMDDGIVVTKTFSLSQQEFQTELKGKVLRITTKEEKPYMMYKRKTAPGEPKSTDPNDWEGFCIDMLNEISKELGFNYTINLVADSSYGNSKKVDGVEVWDGMVEELRTRKMDLAVGSFTITYDRDTVIDFTTPFMYLGISIIYRRPEDNAAHLFSFLHPLSTPVWGYILAATIMVSLVLFVVARFSPYEWRVKHPCNVNGNLLENDFNAPNSLWFTFGALMQKGSDIMPHALSTRIIVGFWWFFTLIIISSYTANLAAFLTVARMESPIESAEDLERQSKIKYGAYQGGSTMSFFEKSNYSVYKRMWKYMSNQKGVIMNSTEEAIKRVKREEYAYLLESTMNEYYTQRNCDLMQIGGLLDSKGYGIGLPEGSKYRDPISQTILKLQKSQTLDKYKHRWWRSRYVEVSCESKQTKSSDTSSLGMEKVGGCFVMLLIGMGVSLVISVLEFLFHSYHKAPKNRSLREELARDFRFTTGCSSVRSKLAEDSAILPPPPPLHCICDRSSTGRQNLSAALAYAPCLPHPDLPAVHNLNEQPVRSCLNRSEADRNLDVEPHLPENVDVANHGRTKEIDVPDTEFSKQVPVLYRRGGKDMEQYSRPRFMLELNSESGCEDWQPGTVPSRMGVQLTDKPFLVETPEHTEWLNQNNQSHPGMDPVDYQLKKIAC